MTSDALRAALGGDSPSMVEGGYRPGNRYEEDLGSRPRPKKEKDNKNKMDLIAKTLSIDPYMHSLGAMDIGEREREVLFRLYYAYAPVLDRMINSRSGLDIREGYPPCLKDLDILIDSIHDNTTASLSGTAFYRGLSYLTNSIRRLSVPLVTRVYQVMKLASEEDPRILERFPAQLCSKIFKVLLYQVCHSLSYSVFLFPGGTLTITMRWWRWYYCNNDTATATTTTTAAAAGDDDDDDDDDDDGDNNNDDDDDDDDDDGDNNNNNDDDDDDDDGDDDDDDVY
jgi:hypothetical protein